LATHERFSDAVAEAEIQARGLAQNQGTEIAWQACRISTKSIGHWDVGFAPTAE